MAGYGNRTAPDYVAENLQEEHTSTRLGLTDSNAAYSNAHTQHGSGTTGGAGFGNKRSSLSTSAPSTSDEEFRFGTHKDTSPYSHATPHGSGSTGGAGFGNKTGSFGETQDSAVGKVLEKAGRVVHSAKLAEKGAAMREKEGFGGAA
ncbi:hypothetical protein IQ07DRAFT_645872 [Pyrenochaeta sp. DS3sAY3a]|nr:hypothetical protein IQ07DRAFT_645872 [Pyrenochaeta sp. DS3sAY3a]